MGYLAIARQWRPSKFDELVGQAHVVQTLKNAIRFNRVSHAYLFCGARGIGKTSVARIFAKALRCPNAVDAVSCNVCPECLLISESRSVDVIEIDGASNNGVEAVRGIRENVAYGASSGNYKIYIIDEVHMLSLSAFNALLKTLEEPPAHVIFIFATTEVQKIPLTIVSRCQRFEFRRLTGTQIVERLNQILRAENLQLSEEGLRAMASHSDGSLRDALSLLDQVLSYYGEKGTAAQALTEKQVVEALGVNDSSAVRLLLSMIVRKDIAGVIGVIGDIYLSGVDLKHFSERCLEELRLLYLIALGRESGGALNAESLDISAGHFAELSELANLAPLIQFERMAQILSKSITQLGWSTLPRFVLEMAAIRMSKLGALAELESGNFVPVAAPTPPSVSPQPPQIEPKVAVAEPAPPSPAAAPTSEAAPVTRTEVGTTQSWKSFVEGLMKKRPLLGALLSHADFKVDGEDGARVIHLAFPGGSFYQRQATGQKTQQEIEEQVKLYFGESATLSFAANLTNGSRSLEQTRQIEEDTAKKNALEHPMVRKMQEILGAEVVDINVDP